MLSQKYPFHHLVCGFPIAMLESRGSPQTMDILTWADPQVDRSSCPSSKRSARCYTWSGCSCTATSLGVVIIVIQLEPQQKGLLDAFGRWLFFGGSICFQGPYLDVPLSSVCEQDQTWIGDSAAATTVHAQMLNPKLRMYRKHHRTLRLKHNL